jgi:hypothetical protein
MLYLNLLVKCGYLYKIRLSVISFISPYLFLSYSQNLPHVPSAGVAKQDQFNPVSFVFLSQKSRICLTIWYPKSKASLSCP